ncbi:hypothetical protein FB567DRAFT_553354 [Paraphoma chrysanthemicola]|uniref:Uncharacterized protein n=1 Tax=Paraphoma chrysanthemicola TaxID=798071 RepID=A0A8K0QX60_9PLEO|nr:hypothetical protein FB567DRAFT_553354 [Paraphoma chrysanthemicola]
MRAYLTVLLCAALLMVAVLAAPLLDHEVVAQLLTPSSGNSTAQNDVSTNTRPKETRSYQLLLHGEAPLKWYWNMWEGPQGVAVNPCNPQAEFKKVVHRSPFIGGGGPDGGSIKNPPFPIAGGNNKIYWSLPNEYFKNCRYESDSTGDSAGTLRCAGLIYDFLPDPQRKDNEIDCGKDGRYGRAFMVEY